MGHVPKVAGLTCLVAVLTITLLAANVHAATSSFGSVSVGTSNSATFGGIVVCNFTGPSDLGTITSVEVYLSTGGTTARAVIYSDSDGKPDVLLAQSEAVTVEGTSGEWVTFDVSYPGIRGGLYWLGVALDSAGTYFYAPNTAGKAIYLTTTTDSLNPFPSENSVTNSNLSVFANYTPAESSNGSGQDAGWLEWVLLGVAIVGVAIAAVLAVITLRKKGNSSA